MSDIQSELPTFWQNMEPSPQWHYDLPRFEEARKGGMPITQAVFDRIPDHEKYITYYIYLCTWPNAKRMYRGSERAISLHRRTVMEGLIRYATDTFHRSTLALELWRPLIEIDPEPLFDEAMCFIRNQTHFYLSREWCRHLFFAFSVLNSPVYREWVMNAESVVGLEEYIHTNIVPFRIPGETMQDSKQKTDYILDVWHNGVKPELETQRLQIYEKATQRLCVYKEELLARAWEYPRYIANCLDESEAKELIQRWTNHTFKQL